MTSRGLLMASPFLWHTQQASSVAHELNTDLDHGITNREATSRLPSYGFNRFPRTEHISWSAVLQRLQVSLMIPVLLVVSTVLILTKQSQKNSGDFFNEAALVLGILVVSFIIGFVQEARSRGMQRSARMYAHLPAYSRAMRNGNIRVVRTVELVPGDIICFDKGDRIPADGRLFKANRLFVDESRFEINTKPVEKSTEPVEDNTPFHRRSNMVFMGTTVHSGSGRAVVTATGGRTQMSRLLQRQSVRDQEYRSFHLEALLSRKGVWLAFGCMALSFVLWILLFVAGKPLAESMIYAASFLMAAWPMGLIETATSAFAIGIRRLDKKGYVVRNTVEASSLAHCTTICSEKSGVMTQNRMAMRKVFVDGRIINIRDSRNRDDPGGFPANAAAQNIDLRLLLSAAAMCNDVEVRDTPEGREIACGTIDGALVVGAMKGGISKEELELSLAKLGELPFDHKRKRMSVIFDAVGDEIYIFTRGTLESILDVCTSIQLHGHIEQLDTQKRRAIVAVNRNFAGSGMRNITFAYRRPKSLLICLSGSPARCHLRR